MTVTDYVKFNDPDDTGARILEKTAGIASVVRNSLGRYTVNFAASRAGRKGIGQAVRGNGSLNSNEQINANVANVANNSAIVQIYTNSNNTFINLDGFAEYFFFG
jgi:hypothetical protein